MRPILLLAALATALAAPTPTPAPAPAPAPAPVPTAPKAPLPPHTSMPKEDMGAGVSGTTAAGLLVHADVRDEYLSGLPILVEIAVTNPTDAPVKTPDLSTRPHLVHFKLVSPEGRVSERYSTPPPFDAGGDWTLAPKSTRTVLLEVPSSAALDMGDWQLTVLVADETQAAILPMQKMRVVPPHPVGGDVTWEGTIAKNTGAIVPWVHQAKGGFDLYLNQYAPGDSGKLLAHSRLFRSARTLVPHLSLTQANASKSRWLYWKGAENEVRVARLEGSRISGTIRSLGGAWPKVELLCRGVSDASGGLLLPVWIPGPKGVSGSVKVLIMEERGGVHFRNVADFDERPPVAEAAVDAAGNLVFVLGHKKGFDVYRADPKDDAGLPVKGVRAWKASDGWQNAGAAFDVLPDKDGRAGGLAILAVQALPGVEKATAQLRTLRVDLAGKLFETSPGSAWAGPLVLSRVVPNGYDTPHFLAHDAAGLTTFGSLGGTPVSLGKTPEAELWPSGDGWRARWIAGERIVTEKAIPQSK